MLGASAWSSPTGRFASALTSGESMLCPRRILFPLPRVDHSVNKIGAGTFIAKVDLVKGYRQVSLSERIMQVACFVANERCTSDR